MGDEEPRPRRKKKKKRASAGEGAPDRVATPVTPEPPPPASSWLPSWAGKIVPIFAFAFLLVVFADASGWEWLGNKVPRPARYFAQIACLFPVAQRAQTEYHAEGWLCRDKRWVEIDVRPWFPIDADEKENRFQRTLHFYYRDRPTMNALDDFIVEHQNRDLRDAGAREAALIGGVRFSSLHVPFPEFGAKIERYAPHSLATSPESAKHDTYFTKRSRRRERCKTIFPEYDDRELDEDKKRDAPAEKQPDTKEAPEVDP